RAVRAAGELPDRTVRTLDVLEVIATPGIRPGPRGRPTNPHFGDRVELAGGRSARIVGVGLQPTIWEGDGGKLGAAIGPLDGMGHIGGKRRLRPKTIAAENLDRAVQALQLPPPRGGIVEELTVLVARGVLRRVVGPQAGAGR